MSDNDKNTLVPWGDQQGMTDYGKYSADKKNVAERSTPVLHVCQNNSPEVDAGIAKPGDCMIRIGGKDNPSNINLGQSFSGITVARGMEYLWWGDRDSGEGIKGRCKVGAVVPNGFDSKDLLWPKEGGNARTDGKAGPVADLTRTFIVAPYVKGDAGDPMMVTYARGGAKAGKQLNLLLNRFKGPEYAAVLQFETFKEKSDDGKPYYVLKAKGVGAIQPDSDLLPKLKAWHDALAPMFAVDEGDAA